MSTQRGAISAHYLSAVMQGLTLVSFPASSAVLKQMHGFTDTEYGAIFLPQVICAVIGAVLGGSLAGRFGLRTILLAVIAANGVSQALLAISAISPEQLAYLAILGGTGAMGFGFGLGGAPFNSYPRLLFPKQSDTALLATHSSIGLGLAVGPLLVSMLAMHGAWIAFPLGLFGGCVALLVLAAAVNLPADPLPKSMRDHDRGPARSPEFWLLLAIGAVYAFAEGTFSNWAVIFVHEARGLPETTGTLALSVFWAALVVGRVLISVLLLRVNPLVPWAVFPIVIVAAFLSLPQVSTPIGAVAGFALAGLGCSAFFPLTVATASTRFPAAVPFVSSMLTAALMIGSGVASFAIGGLRMSLSLEQLYRASTFYPVVVLLLIAFTIRATRRRAAS